MRLQWEEGHVLNAGLFRATLTSVESTEVGLILRFRKSNGFAALIFAAAGNPHLFSTAKAESFSGRYVEIRERPGDDLADYGSFLAPDEKRRLDQAIAEGLPEATWSLGIRGFSNETLVVVGIGDPQAAISLIEIPTPFDLHRRVLEWLDDLDDQRQYIGEAFRHVDLFVSRRTPWHGHKNPTSETTSPLTAFKVMAACIGAARRRPQRDLVVVLMFALRPRRWAHSLRPTGKHPLHRQTSIPPEVVAFPRSRIGEFFADTDLMLEKRFVSPSSDPARAYRRLIGEVACFYYEAEAKWEDELPEVLRYVLYIWPPDVKGDASHAWGIYQSK